MKMLFKFLGKHLSLKQKMKHCPKITQNGLTKTVIERSKNLKQPETILIEIKEMELEHYSPEQELDITEYSKRQKHVIKNEGQRLENIAKSQPNKFWKSLKKCYSTKKQNENDIKLEDLHQHFNTHLGQTTNRTNVTDDVNQMHIEDVE